jgi:hypothetical protein
MIIEINDDTIKALNPCEDRLINYLGYHSTTKFRSLRQFLKLKNITYDDKLWVVLKLIPNETKVIFALDCVFAGYIADAAGAAYAAYAAANAAANAAAYAAGTAYAVYTADAADAAAIKKEENRQIKALIYLIENES